MFVLAKSHSLERRDKNKILTADGHCLFLAHITALCRLGR